MKPWQPEFITFEKAYKNFVELASCDIENLENALREGFTKRFDMALITARGLFKSYLMDKMKDKYTEKTDTIYEAHRYQCIKSPQI